MQNFTKQSLLDFTANNAQKAKQTVIDHKKPILIIVALILVALIGFQAVKMLHKDPSQFD